MNKSHLAVAAVAVLLSGSAFAAELTTTTTSTWTNEQGAMIREQSVVKHYNNVSDPKIETTIGTEVPTTVTMYALPETIKVPEPERYSYVIVNDHPVIVEKRTRRIIHAW
jgi:archaellum component FlaG (FlaF/FlaG flagellin family)